MHGLISSGEWYVGVEGWKAGLSQTKMRSAVYEDCGVRSRQVGELLRTMVSRERTMPFQPMRVVIQAATRVVASRNPTTNVYGKLFLFVFFAVSSGALLRPKEESRRNYYFPLGKPFAPLAFTRLQALPAVPSFTGKCQKTPGWNKKAISYT